MSLRARLILMVAVALAVSLALGGTLATIDAARSLGHEMRTTLDHAQRTVTGSVAVARTSPEWRHDLDRLVAALKSNPDLRVSWSAGGATVPRLAPAMPKTVPTWFTRLIGVYPETVAIPITVDGKTAGVVRLATAPGHALRRVWDEALDWLIAWAGFALVVVLLVYVVIGGAMRPLRELAAALAAVGRGDYTARIEGSLPPELSRLRDRFNRMSSELGRLAEQNRRLTAELLTLQEQERCDIARDLHDDVAHLLSGIDGDAAAAVRALKDGRGDEVPAHLAVIADAIGQAQGRVQEMLSRLRPIGLAEFGLATAIGNLVEHWRHRHPEIIYLVSIAAGITGYGETIDLVVYRVVEEGLANSLRHARPTRVAITIAEQANLISGDEAIVIATADDGFGSDEDAALGYALSGVTERVKTVGGRLSLKVKPGRGLTVTAVLPRPRVGRSAETFLS
ncbi:MAG: histidine kinase [Stellaceae bacterium]